MNRPKNKMLDCLKQMPPLRHRTGDGEFDIMKSEVVDWMVNQPEVRQWLYDKVTDKTGGRKAVYICYNQQSSTWQGVDYDGD